MANTLPGTPYVESSDLVANYPAVSEDLAERVDLVGVLPFADAAARTTALPTPTDGQYSYLQDTNSTEFYDGAAWVALGGGKVLQVVRATDTTQRTTTSVSFVDATISVTITPTKNTSAIIVMWSAVMRNSSSTSHLRITDSSDNPLSGAEDYEIGSSGIFGNVIAFGYATPATTSPVTYKARFRSESGTTDVKNNINTGQMYAIEVSA